MRTGVIGLLILGTLAAAPAAQNLDDMARLENDFRVIPNVTYHTASNMDLKVDLYVRRDTSQPQPTLLFFGDYILKWRKGLTIELREDLRLKGTFKDAVKALLRPARLRHMIPTKPR